MITSEGKSLKNWAVDTRHYWIESLRIFPGFLLVYIGCYFVQNLELIYQHIETTTNLDAFVVAHYVVFAHLLGGVMIIAGLLTRLQKRWSPVLASVTIGVIWGLWHLDPGIVAAGLQGGWSEFFSRWAPYQSVMVPSTIALSFMMTAIYNRTLGSLFAVMLLHAVHNAFMSATGEAWGPQMDPLVDPANWQLRILLIASLWVVAAMVWSWYGKYQPIVVDEHGRLPRDVQG